VSSGFEVDGSGLTFKDSGSEVEGSHGIDQYRVRVWGLGFGVYGLGVTKIDGEGWRKIQD
jgi:hypothetical protein